MGLTSDFKVSRSSDVLGSALHNKSHTMLWLILAAKVFGVTLVLIISLLLITFISGESLYEPGVWQCEYSGCCAEFIAAGEKCEHYGPDGKRE
jgi:hypothetical protein